MLNPGTGLYNDMNHGMDRRVSYRLGMKADVGYVYKARLLDLSLHLTNEHCDNVAEASLRKIFDVSITEMNSINDVRAL